MHVWNVIRAWFQEKIQEMGVEETSFPMFLSSKSLEKVGNCPRFFFVTTVEEGTILGEFESYQPHFLGGTPFLPLPFTANSLNARLTLYTGEVRASDTLKALGS